MLTKRHYWALILCLCYCIATFGTSPTNGQIRPQYKQVKVTDFKDPYTGYLYRVMSNNVTLMTTDSTYRSNIKVSRVKIDPFGVANFKDQENIQTINFHPSLVDYHLAFGLDYCYLVAVTSRTKRNVELYSWKRTQFDLITRRDSFARPHAVRLFRIKKDFFIAIAQDQLHLASLKLSHDEEEPARFLGNAILKFTKGYERDIRYHQFIKLPFTPYQVNHLISENPNNININGRRSVDHYIAFSADADWHDPSSSSYVSTFVYSPLNQHFWPYRFPKNFTTSLRPGTQIKILNFPPEPPRWSSAFNSTKQQPDVYMQPIESCFSQLQRLLSDRELHSRRLVDSSKSLWRTNQNTHNYQSANNLTQLSARVIVHGDVIVKGSVIESPQISLIGGQSPRQPHLLYQIIDGQSPAIVENKLKLAKFRLEHIRNKLSRAVPANIQPGSLMHFNSKIRFFNTLQTKSAVFGRHGVANSDVRLNGLPFKQLERELVSLQGVQDIAAKVTFRGNVVADFLEIHGEINDERYKLIDAIDITSKKVQIIETGPAANIPGYQPPLQFASVQAPEVVIGYNITFNDITLNDFITKDPGDQVIVGRKSFKRLSMGKLDVGNPSALLNEHNINQLAATAIRVHNNSGGQFQSIGGKSLFTRPIRANRLVINNLVNRRINVTSLILDSVKRLDPSIQHISGLKQFLSPLKISRLTTDGTINGVQIDQVFNLNPLPLVPNYTGFVPPNSTSIIPPVTGTFIFTSHVDINGSLNTNLINNVDISRQAIRRFPHQDSSYLTNHTSPPPQLVSGHKVFYRPLRVLNSIRMMNQQQLAGISPNRPRPWPLINGHDFRQIIAGIKRQQMNPNPIFIENLDIDGNLILDSGRFNYTGPTTFGNHSYCPIEQLSKKLVLAGKSNQVVDVPIRINSLRARSAFFEPGALNQMNFPDNFVLRSGKLANGSRPVEPVYGHKVFQQIVIVPLFAPQYHGIPPFSAAQGIVFGSKSTINNIPYDELKTFVDHERMRNSTGEIVVQTLNVYGNIHARRINGNQWPEDIILKTMGPLNRRIYSPLIFTEASHLEVTNQLELRGPVQLIGRLNGVNLTEFALKSVTYGDKEITTGRPLVNKVFLGGISVVREMRSQGLIDGVDINEMRSRVVTNELGLTVPIFSHKSFMSDVLFEKQVNIAQLGDLRLDDTMKKIFFRPGSNEIIIVPKKSITGALRINKLLVAEALINGINFVDLSAKAISLSPQAHELKFNQTLTVEGDIFVDNILVDEKEGLIDGVKMSNLIPISIVYEGPSPNIMKQALIRPPVTGQDNLLKNAIISFNIIDRKSSNQLIVGFIDAPFTDLANYRLSEEVLPDYTHVPRLSSFMLLDETDFPFPLTTQHLSAGIFTGPTGNNLTSVFTSIGGSVPKLLSTLPIESPNSAKFLKAHGGALFLLVSQDYQSTQVKQRYHHCPTPGFMQSTGIVDYNPFKAKEIYSLVEGIHVYLYHALQNSSLLTSSYFDLYQTIDLPAIDSFETFTYHDSTYVLAISRPLEKVYLLLLRGYSGFQVVSYVDTPMIETVRVIYTADMRPALIIHRTNGSHRLMESVLL